MRDVTLCFLLKDEEILLAIKKRSLSGFGAAIGKLNGVGGKVDEGEGIRTAAIRELKEEIGVSVKENELEEVGNIRFHFKDKPEWDQHVHIFTVRSWEGEPQESEEMKPQWFDIKDIPFDAMWPDDKHWLPMVLAGKKVEGEFNLINEGANIDDFDIREI